MNSSCRPYLVRAIYDWIVDTDMTPYVIVNVMLPDVAVPTEYVDNQNRIILNISPMAVREFLIDIEEGFIAFQARFSGIVYDIFLPMVAVMAIYAHETGRGMLFDEEDAEGPNAVAPAAGVAKSVKVKVSKKDKRPAKARTKTSATGLTLTVIEGGKSDDEPA